jgi:hypothetical protein
MTIPGATASGPPVVAEAAPDAVKGEGEAEGEDEGESAFASAAPAAPAAPADGPEPAGAAPVVLPLEVAAVVELIEELLEARSDRPGGVAEPRVEEVHARTRARTTPITRSPASAVRHR